MIPEQGVRHARHEISGVKVQLSVGLAVLASGRWTDPDHLDDVGLAWRAFRTFLAMPLNGLFDRWTAARSGEFVAEDLAEAEEPVMAVSEAKPLRSRIELVNPN